MALFRSNSLKSTTSAVENSRATKYQSYMNLSNVFILTVSTILVFTSVVLMRFYHINKLGFWSAYFEVVPLQILGLGIFTVIICLFGLFITRTENKALISTYAVLLAITFLVQLSSIFTALELRTKIVQEDISAAAVNDDLIMYTVDKAITAKWDQLQTDLRCCGGNNFGIGYNDYRNTPIGNAYSIPDTCCHEYREGCGRNMFKQTPEHIRLNFYVDGCLTLLRRDLEDDVVPMMVAYSCLGVVLAILELVTVALACAYIAQITRRRKRRQRQLEKQLPNTLAQLKLATTELEAN